MIVSVSWASLDVRRELAWNELVEARYIARYLAVGTAEGIGPGKSDRSADHDG